MHVLVLAGERPSRPTNRDILGLSEDVWALMEKCWDRVPSVRPHAADVLFLLGTASRGWVPPSSETIASLGLGRPTSGNDSVPESANTMLETMLGTIGGCAADSREAEQSSRTSNGEEGTAI